MAAVLASPPVEDDTSIEDFFHTLGQEYINVWERTTQQKAPAKLIPGFLGFFLWYNVINAASD